jgi:hypothetical protein
MKRYLDLSGTSGVRAYAIGEQTVTVQFADGGAYLYSYASAGRERVEEMKRCALAGRGLSTYISQHVGQAYESKS